MISENENPAGGNSPSNPDNANKQTGHSGETGESAMTILEKRLAEIAARKKEGTAPAELPAVPISGKPTSEITSEIKPEPINKTEPVNSPEIFVEQVKTSPEIRDTEIASPITQVSTSGTETSDVMSGAIAAREVIPPVVTEGSVLHPEITDEDAMDSSGKVSANPDSDLTDSRTLTGNEYPANSIENKVASINTEDVYRPNVSDLPDIDTRVDNTVAPTPENMAPAANNSSTDYSYTNSVEETGTHTIETTETGRSANLFVPAANIPESQKVTEAERDAALGNENSIGNIISGAIAMHEVIPEITPAQRQESEIENSGNLQNSTRFDETTEDDTLTDTDFSGLSADEMGVRIIALIKTGETKKNSRQINALYREYELKSGQEKTESRERYIAEGGIADDFEFRLSPERQAVEKAMQTYRENRHRDFKNEEEQKLKNLQRKQELIVELRSLIEGAETKASSDRIKAIQEEWKATGPVPQGESQELWNSYHALLDIFYNNRGIFNELKDLDRKRNLAAKEALISRAEALLQNPSINESLNELKHLHEEWKHIGPVPNDQRDPVWERFLAASEKVHDRKKEFLAGRKIAENENLLKKSEILQRMEEFENFNTDRINDWRDKTDEIQKIKTEWDAAGLVPKENADQINKRFWGIYKQFFNQKNAYFKALDEMKMANLKQKTELCERAEAIKDSTDFDATKEELIRMQKQWKTIGRVPDKYSDKIWERFRAACNEFFDRKQAEVEQKEQELEKISAEKTGYLTFLTQEIDNPENKVIGSLDELYAMENKWRSFDGENQRTNPRAEEKFYSLMEKYLDTVPELTYDEKNAILFKLQMDKLKNGPDAADKIRQKEHSIRKEIGQLENDIRTLNTNIEFFARSKNAAQLREEYQQRTDEAQKRIDNLNKQLKALRS